MLNGAGSASQVVLSAYVAVERGHVTSSMLPLPGASGVTGGTSDATLETSSEAQELKLQALQVVIEHACQYGQVVSLWGLFCVHPRLNALVVHAGLQLDLHADREYVMETCSVIMQHRGLQIHSVRMSADVCAEVMQKVIHTPAVFRSCCYSPALQISLPRNSSMRGRCGVFFKGSHSCVDGTCRG